MGEAYAIGASEKALVPVGIFIQHDSKRKDISTRVGILASSCSGAI